MSPKNKKVTVSKLGLVIIPTEKKTTNYVLSEFDPINPLPMQYLGSKGRISRWIVGNISKELVNAKTIVDLFAGTGAVSLEALHQGYRVILNDIQPYSYAVLNSLFYAPKKGLSPVSKELQKFVSKNSNLLKGHRKKLEDYLIQEDDFIQSLIDKKFNWKKYKKFSDSTERLVSNDDLIANTKAKKHNLFSWYYPNTYFGIRQCLEIDTIREFADDLPTHLKSHVLASVISTLTFNVSSTTHLAQFLKPNNQKQAEVLLKKRTKSIIDSVIHRLQKLSEFSMPSADSVFNLDYLEALKKIPANKSVVIYADPPYFKEHYSRYYHVLDTFFLYDYPELSLNPQTHKLTEGKYRANRIISKFGLRSQVSKAFSDMLNECAKKKFSVVISYANTSLIDKVEMKKIISANRYKIVSLKEKDLMHSAQGQPSNKIIQEYLYTLIPQDE